MSTTYESRRGLGTPAYNDGNWYQVLDANRALLASLPAISDCAVTTNEIPSASLNIRVASGTFKNSAGAKVTCAGATGVACTPSTTNYVYLTEAGAPVVNTSGFPAAGTFHVPLATVVAGATTITSIADAQVHLSSSGGDVFAPPLASPTVAAGAGAGTTPTVTVTGTARAGTLSVTTGTSPTVSAVVATVTYASAFAAAPRAVLLFPTNAAAAALTGGAKLFVSSNIAASFALTVGSSGLAASTAYTWNYLVIG